MKPSQSNLQRIVVLLVVIGGAGLALAQKPDAKSDPIMAAIQRAQNNLAVAEKGSAQAAAALAVAEKSLAAKVAALRAATDTAKAAQEKAARAPAAEKADAAKVATASRAALDKAAMDKAAADKLVAARTEAVNAAANRVRLARAALRRANMDKRLQGVAEARSMVLKVEVQKGNAEATLRQKSTAADQAIAKAATAKAEAAKATADAAAARTVLRGVTEAGRLAAEKVLKEKEASAKAAAHKAATLQALADKAAAEKATARQAACDQEAAIRAGRARLASVKTEAFGGLPLLPDASWDYAKARHLLYRAGFGGTPEEVARLHALGLHGAVDYLVNYRKLPALEHPFQPQLPERPEAYERSLPAADRNLLSQQRQRQERDQLQALRTWWLKRMVESPRPLEEKMTLFWHGHFACQYTTVLHSYFMYQQNQLFREHAVGNFGALVQGIVKDPTMLRYLNNDTNVKGHPNENLAREIMELFAFGLDQGYTEQDIREAARALTGYTYDRWSGQFRFIESRHDDGPKTIFGRTGPWTGDDLADLILQQPATSRFIARKLFTFFAYDNPEPATVERLAAVLRGNNYELVPTLENLFLSQEFYSPRCMGTQIKSPCQLIVGALRELRLTDVDYAYLVQALRNMGQDLLEPPSVKGWDGGRTWVNATRVFVRYNTFVYLLENRPRRAGTSARVAAADLLAAKIFQSREALVDYLARTFLAVPLNPSKRQALVDFLSDLPPTSEWPSHRAEVNAKLNALLLMLMSAPEYQVT